MYEFSKTFQEARGQVLFWILPTIISSFPGKLSENWMKHLQLPRINGPKKVFAASFNDILRLFDQLPKFRRFIIFFDAAKRIKGSMDLKFAVPPFSFQQSSFEYRGAFGLAKHCYISSILYLKDYHFHSDVVTI